MSAEVVGYVASGLIVLSMAMSRVLRLRIINLVGAGLFTVYGIMIGALPIVLLDGIIVVLDVFFIYKLVTDAEYFTLLEIKPDSRYMHSFLDFHRQDITRFQPDFRFEPEADCLYVLLMRDMVPTGLFIGERVSPDVLMVRLDYAIPKYRDLRMGRYLYGLNRSFFTHHGLRTLCTEPGNRAHQRYLERVGFKIGAGGLRCLDL